MEDHRIELLLAADALHLLLIHSCVGTWPILVLRIIVITRHVFIYSRGSFLVQVGALGFMVCGFYVKRNYAMVLRGRPLLLDDDDGGDESKLHNP